ncbi:hypothetical protein ACEV8E_23360, partial [Vibrio parahaemolyticus]
LLQIKRLCHNALSLGGGVVHPLIGRYVLGGHGGISKGQGNFWRFSETCCKAVQSPRIQAFKQKREARMAASLDSRLFTNHWAL